MKRIRMRRVAIHPKGQLSFHVSDLKLYPGQIEKFEAFVRNLTAEDIDRLMREQEERQRKLWEKFGWTIDGEPKKDA